MYSKIVIIFIGVILFWSNIITQEVQAIYQRPVVQKVEIQAQPKIQARPKIQDSYLDKCLVSCGDDFECRDNCYLNNMTAEEQNQYKAEIEK
jgi:hypothetical protein